MEKLYLSSHFVSQIWSLGIVNLRLTSVLFFIWVGYVEDKADEGNYSS